MPQKDSINGNDLYLENTSIPAHELHFRQMCKQYLLYQAKGNQELAAVRLGVVNEIVSHLQE